MLGGRVDKRLRGSASGWRPPTGWRLPPGWRTRRAGLIAGGVAAVVVAGLLTWILWPAPEAEPRAREYRDVTACLLTDRQGVTGTDAAAVWAGLQAASERTHGQVRYLAVTGEQSAGNAQTFAGTLVAGRCTVIVAGPGLAGEAVRVVAARQPQQSFLVVGGAATTLRNVSRVAGPDVTSLVAAAVGDRLAAAG